MTQNPNWNVGLLITLFTSVQLMVGIQLWVNPRQEHIEIFISLSVFIFVMASESL